MNIMFKSLGSAAHMSNYRPENHFPKLLLLTDLCLPQNTPGYREGADVLTFFSNGCSAVHPACRPTVGHDLSATCPGNIILLSHEDRTFQNFPL